MIMSSSDEENMWLGLEVLSQSIKLETEGQTIGSKSPFKIFTSQHSITVRIQASKYL